MCACLGLYTSPHISSFRERILVDGELIPESEVRVRCCQSSVFVIVRGSSALHRPLQVIRLLPPLYAACEAHDVPATFFELTTLAAFAHFARSRVDAGVIEVGLG